MAVFIGLWSCLYTTKLKSVIRHNLGDSIELSARGKLARKYGANINLRHRSCLLLKITVGIHAIPFVVMVGMTIITCRLFCYLKSKDFVVKGLEYCTG